MQPVTEGLANQSEDGDFLALGLAGALEQECQLFLLGAFANQARQPTVCQDPPDHKPAQIGCHQVFRQPAVILFVILFGWAGRTAHPRWDSILAVPFILLR